MISEHALKGLVQEFLVPRDEFGGKSYVTRRREWFDKPMETIRPLLSRERLSNLTLGEAERIYNEMTVGGPRLYPRTYAENGLEKIRAALSYLIYGPGDLAKRFSDFTGNPESEFRLNGVGRAFASTALFLIDHNQNAIWNSAVDGGLKKLRMLPGRASGASLGDQYVATVAVLKKLQTACGFEDLSVTDEFVELVFHGKIGAAIATGTEKELEKAAETEEAHPPQGAEEATHLRIQYLLVKIGLMGGYDAWVASNDRGRTYGGEALLTITLGDLPAFADPSTLRVAKAIDVIWFKRRTSQPVCFFEIEHTTSMYSGLLRLNDVKTNYPIPKAYIVAPKERRTMFDSQIQRPTFAQSELNEVCQFLDYEQVEALLKSYQTIATILP